MSCPFCGSNEFTPIEDAWSCRKCGREWPTLAYKCKHPDCWEWVYFKDYCRQHAGDHKKPEG